MSLSITCSVCLEDIKEGEKYFTTNCDHSFHHHCFQPWNEKSGNCPMCRGEVKNYKALTFYRGYTNTTPNSFYLNQKKDGYPVKLNGNLYERARKRLLNEDSQPSHYLLIDEVKMPMYRLYDEDEVGEIKTITLFLRMKIIFFSYVENIEMRKFEDSQGNVYYDAVEPIYERNMGSGQIHLAYEFIEWLLNVLSERHDFKIIPCIYSLIFDLFFEVIENFCLEDKNYRFKTAICSAISSAVSFYYTTPIKMNELLDITTYNSTEEELESYNVYLNYLIRENLCIIA